MAKHAGKTSFKMIIYSRRTLVLILTLALLLLEARSNKSLFNSARHNLWSSKYLHFVFNSGRKGGDKFDFPPDHPRAAIWFGQEAMLEGNLSNSRSFLSPYVDQENPFAQSIFGKASYASGDHSQAISSWVEAGDIQSLWKAGNELSKNGQNQLALQAYLASYVLSPEQSVLYLADFHQKQEQDLEQAEAVLKAALKDFSKSRFRREWLHALAEVLQTKQNWSESENVFEQILAEYPNDRTAHIGLGWCNYEGRSDPHKAIAEFNLAISLDPMQGHGYFAIGQLMARENRYDEADGWFQKAIERNSDRRLWYLIRANMARNNKNLVLALDVYSDTVTLFPDFTKAYYEMAWAYYMADEFDAAVHAIEKAFDLLEAPDHRYNLRSALIYERAGNIQKAKDQYLQVLSMDSDNKTAQSGLIRLENK